MKLHLHHHKYYGQKGANRYGMCRCGRRKLLIRTDDRGYTPIDQGWLDGRAEWESPKPKVA